MRVRGYSQFFYWVALRKESVDRNVPRQDLINGISLVALRKESVDRNMSCLSFRLVAGSLSLSARRAWIEIDSAVDSASGTLVALRKESVDRNPYLLWQFGRAFCRSPQGERG